MKELIKNILYKHVSSVLEQRESWTLEKLKDLTSQFENYSEFLKSEPNAVHALRRLGVLDEFTSHMTRSQSKPYTDDEIEKEARKYTNQSDFAKGSPNYYNAYKRRKLQSKFRSFLPTKITRWTDEMLRDEAKKYTSMIDFLQNSASAYKTAYDRGILDDITKHISKVKKWTYEEALEEAKKYNTLAEFAKNSPAYYQSRENGWLDNFKEFLDHTIRWTKEMTAEEASKYKTKREFKEKSPKAYSAAHSHGWIDDITKHMDVLGDKFNRMVYVYEFPDKHVYVGLTFDKMRRNYSHLDTEKITSPVAKHIVETGLKPTYKDVSAYISAAEAQNLENCTMERYRQEGWTLLNRMKGGGLGACRTSFTKEQVLKIAKKYKKRIDFKSKDAAAYRAAQKYGWLKDAVSHIPKHDSTVWTYEKTKELAKKSKSRSDLKNKSQSAYTSALKNGWLDEFFPVKLKNQFDKRK